MFSRKRGIPDADMFRAIPACAIAFWMLTAQGWPVAIVERLGGQQELELVSHNPASASLPLFEHFQNDAPAPLALALALPPFAPSAFAAHVGGGFCPLGPLGI